MLNYDACQRLVEFQARVTDPYDLHSVEQELMMFLLSHPLFSDPKLANVQSSAEKIYAALFCSGNVEVARHAILFKAAEEKGGWDYNLGLRLGSAAIMFAWVLWDCLIDPSMGRDVWHDPAFKVYRGLGNCVLLVWMWGVNLQVWRSYHIDYSRVLCLNPKDHTIDPCLSVWKAAGELSFAWMLSFICFYKALRGVFLDTVPPQLAHAFPLLLFLYVGYRMLFPWKERVLMWSSIFNTMAAPFAPVRFRDGYVGDVLTSTVRVIVDLTFAALWFLSGVHGWLQSDLDLKNTSHVENLWLFKQFLVPGITVAPLFWRFLQNINRAWVTQSRWPHLGNALKYASAQTVVLFGFFHQELRQNPTWILCFVLATLYQYWWDIFMDWDLLHWTSSSGFELRSNLLYKNKSFYIFIAVINLALRFLWTITLLPEANNNLFTQKFDVNLYLSPFIAAAEVCRRSIWGFLRVENEHIQVYERAQPKIDNQQFPETGTQQDSLSFEKETFSPMEVGVSSMTHPHVEEKRFTAIPAIVSRPATALAKLFGVDLIWRTFAKNPQLFIELVGMTLGVILVSVVAAHVNL